MTGVQTCALPISLVVQCGGSSSPDTFDHMCEEIDSKVVRDIDALIDSLSFPQRDAMRHKWLGNSKTWPTQEMDYADALESLLKLAEKRGMV